MILNVIKYLSSYSLSSLCVFYTNIIDHQYFLIFNNWMVIDNKVIKHNIA